MLQLTVVILAVFILDITYSIDTPTLEVVPLPDEKRNTLIYYKGSDNDGFQPWTDKINRFLEHYKTPGLISGARNTLYNCDYENPPPDGHVCDVDVKYLQPCIAENYFNYHRSSPCVFLKLTNVLDWIPAYYNDSSQLPKQMPNSLKEYITSNDQRQLNQIWISCEGKYPADVEFIGPISYLPRRGFPGYYFPYKNIPGYLSPLVAVNFKRPFLGVAINIVCKAWAKNIIHNIDDNIGTVQFQLLID